MNNTNKSARAQRGFTLLEVLVAIIILAIGLLGVASLQAKGIRYSYSSSLRSQAVTLSYELIDKMRANRNWGIRSLDSLENYDTTAAWPTSAADCDSVPCTQAQMAEYDLRQWQLRLEDQSTGLPGGSAQVCVALVDPSLANYGGDPCSIANQANASAVLVSVEITWTDDPGESGTSPSGEDNRETSFLMETML